MRFCFMTCAASRELGARTRNHLGALRLATKTCTSSSTRRIFIIITVSVREGKSIANSDANLCEICLIVSRRSHYNLQLVHHIQHWSPLLNFDPIEISQEIGERAERTERRILFHSLGDDHAVLQRNGNRQATCSSQCL